MSIFPKSIFTARKQSLGQGNIFIGVCQEFCSQGGGCLLRGVSARGDGVCFRGVCLVETPPTDTAAGGTHPTGMHSCHP